MKVRWKLTIAGAALAIAALWHRSRIKKERARAILMERRRHQKEAA